MFEAIFLAVLRLVYARSKTDLETGWTDQIPHFEGIQRFITLVKFDNSYGHPKFILNLLKVLDQLEAYIQIPYVPHGTAHSFTLFHHPLKDMYPFLGRKRAFKIAKTTIFSLFIGDDVIQITIQLGFNCIQTSSSKFHCEK